jgi:hypothetical protein
VPPPTSFAAARAAIERFGWRSAPSKEVPPVRAGRVEVLGVELDLAAGRLRLAAGKRERYAVQAAQVAAARETAQVLSG